MKYTNLIGIGLFAFLVCSLCLVNASDRDLNLEESKRKAERFGVSDDSFEENGEEETEDESAEYTPLGPPGINAYLFGRSLRKGGFNAWAGRRDLERHRQDYRPESYKHNKRSKKLLKMRQRRRPWGGSPRDQY
ncbi:unnamed protein product [Brachionus calyciflorus]|uniref:Uncharacterized protein n=1 Tax=Brachionus calyciflorus TaxID=104777 RepID=A0A813PQ83_9BILA|nr:unnamed protein product [Brachionus calyciflorus]